MAIIKGSGVGVKAPAKKITTISRPPAALKAKRLFGPYEPPTPPVPPKPPVVNPLLLREEASYLKPPPPRKYTPATTPELYAPVSQGGFGLSTGLTDSQIERAMSYYSTASGQLASGQFPQLSWMPENNLQVTPGSLLLNPAAGGGGGGAPAPLAPLLGAAEPEYDLYKWTQGTYEAPGGSAPGWWRAMTPDRITERSSYAMMLNAMIPYMSPEDQVRAANSLYTFDPEGFSLYKFDRIPELRSVSPEEARYRATMDIPLGQASVSEVSPGQTRSRGVSEFEFSTPLREEMLGGQRARDAITALSNMREATVQGNRWKLGPGYTFLQDILGNLKNYGGDEAAGQSRSDYLAMMGALDPVMAMAGNTDLAAYGPMGQMLANPFFTAGQVRPTTQVANRRLFGTPNPLYY